MTREQAIEIIERNSESCLDDEYPDMIDQTIEELMDGGFSEENAEELVAQVLTM
jgi:hypothetical protein